MKARPEDPIKPSRTINNSHDSIGHTNKTKSLSHSTKNIILQQEIKQHEVKFITCKVGWAKLVVATEAWIRKGK